MNGKIELGDRFLPNYGLRQAAQVESATRRGRVKWQRPFGARYGGELF